MKKTPSPNPHWKPGDVVKGLGDSFQTIDPASLPPGEMYKLLTASVVPRPIAFVSTRSKAGVVNLAPFSFFNAVSSNPPCLVLGISRRADGTPKDTHRNIIETNEFVVNSANSWLIEPLVHCGGNFAPDVDEMKITGLTPIPSVKVAPPRVKEAAVQFECVLHKTVDLGDGAKGATILLIGRIVQMHVASAAYQDGRINTDLLQPVGRLGGISYVAPESKFEIKIPNP